MKLKRIYDSDAPKGVIGRSSDNTTIKKYLEWEPDIPLRQGLEKTYAWIYNQYVSSHNQSSSEGTTRSGTRSRTVHGAPQ